MEEKGIITCLEKDTALRCIDIAKKAGADAVRVSLSKSIQSAVGILDGKVDKISYNADCSLFFHIFSSDRYGTFSTNRLDIKDLESFLGNAVKMTRLLSPDSARTLPKACRKAVDCSQGDELGLYDESFAQMTQNSRLGIARDSAAQNQLLEMSDSAGLKLVSNECEYSDNLDDNYMVDSDGFEGRHIETSWGFCSEVTITGNNGRKFSGYWWDSAPLLKDFNPAGTSAAAFGRAADQVRRTKLKSGKYDIIVDRVCASRLVAPLLNALDGYSLQQGNSFLSGSLGQCIFPEELDIYDFAREKGKCGSRLFDTEGVATANDAIIQGGVVRKYFIDTYIAGKGGFIPTLEGPSRPKVRCHICNCDEKEISLEDILARTANCIYITGFNGGNCNAATGNFSFGIEGFAVRAGERVGAVNEAVMTGNMISLWKNLFAAADDARECTRWQIPSLAFRNIDINI